jgi:hypothetical protein
MALIQTLSNIKWGQPVRGIQGPNERVIELPLAFEVLALDTPGRVLDAGCACNAQMPDPVADLTHLTQSLAHEPVYVQPNRTYASGDLRDLSAWPDRHFDRVVCVSTLEHVGMDNRHYGGAQEHDPDSVTKAVEELWRVCNGTLLITVPFRHDAYECGKWRAFLPATMSQLFPMGPYAWTSLRTDLVYYAKTEDGWHGPYCHPQPSHPDAKPIRQIAVAKLWRY